MEIDQILLVDDDGIVNFIHSTLIKSELRDVKVKAFENGLLALNYIKENPDARYLVFLDINMPVMNGWEFLDSLEREEVNFNGEVIILTSSIEDADRRKAREYNLVQNFLSKPLQRQQISWLGD